LAHWKADEYKNFALFLFPIMENFLRKAYFLHFKDFCIIYRILSKETINVLELQTAEKMLAKFQKNTRVLYSERMFTIKLHSVCYHLLESVKNFGPISQFSAKRFEDINGKLMRKNYGKYKIADQLMIKFAIPSVIHLLVDYFEIQKGSFLGIVLQKIGFEEFSTKFDKWVCFDEKIMYLPENSFLKANNPHHDLIVNSLNVKDTKNVRMVKKLKFKGDDIKKFVTKKRDSTHVVLSRNQKSVVAKVRELFEFQGKLYLICQEIRTFNDSFYVRMRPTTITNDFFICCSDILESPCVFLSGTNLPFWYFVRTQMKDTKTSDSSVFPVDFLAPKQKFTPRQIKAMADNGSYYK